MTSPHAVEPVEARDAEEAIELIRRGGLRLSSARRVVVEALFAAGEPVPAERIAAGAGGGTPLDLPTVYRNLELLERLGLVRHFHVGHGPGLYAPAAAEDREYLVCEECGELRTVEPRALDGVRDLIAAELGFQARFSHFPIAGRCARCSGGGGG